MKNFFKGLLIFICVAVVAVTCVSCVSMSDGVDDEKTTVEDIVTQEETSEMLNGYYYNQLSDVEKRAYDRIISKIYTMPDEIYVPRLDENQLDAVFAALLRDNPDIFFTGRKVSHRNIGFGMLCSIDYIFSQEEYETCKAELDAVCDEVIASLSNPNDEWQTELEIHDYIIENCSYDVVENEHIYSSAYGALVNGEAACEGYSKAMQLLLDRVGIENYVICGNATNQDGVTGPHMWNVVKINGDFYHLDCTWDDPRGNQTENHLYFNVNDEMISETHSDFPEDFGCTATAENYYKKKDTYFENYSGGNKEKMISIVAREINAGSSSVEFSFGSEKDAQNALETLCNGDLTGYRRVSAESGVDFSESNPVYEVIKSLGVLRVHWNTQTEGTDTNG